MQLHSSEGCRRMSLVFHVGTAVCVLSVTQHPRPVYRNKEFRYPPKLSFISQPVISRQQSVVSPTPDVVLCLSFPKGICFFFCSCFCSCLSCCHSRRESAVSSHQPSGISRPQPVAGTPQPLLLLFCLSFPKGICCCLCLCLCFSFCHSRRESAVCFVLSQIPPAPPVSAAAQGTAHPSHGPISVPFRSSVSLQRSTASSRQEPGSSASPARS